MNLIPAFALSFISVLAGCSTPAARFITSYKDVWNMENRIGMAYQGNEVAKNRLIGLGALSIWSGQKELLHRSQCFDDFESSVSEQEKYAAVRKTIQKVLRDIGCAFAFESLTTGGATGGRTFPWSNYMSPDEYRQIAQDTASPKSVFARKAWWIRNYDQLNRLPSL